MSQEQREVLDPKLFVGDRGGLKKLKTETRRMVSRPDRQVVFMSGLRKEGEEEDVGEGSSSKWWKSPGAERRNSDLQPSHQGNERNISHTSCFLPAPCR